jgi:hypothetical protein
MDWQSFESKLLAAAAYDAEKHTLYLRFRSGDVYRYFEFPDEQYQDLLDAESRAATSSSIFGINSATNDCSSSRPPDRRVLLFV